MCRIENLLYPQSSVEYWCSADGPLKTLCRSYGFCAFKNGFLRGIFELFHFGRVITSWLFHLISGSFKCPLCYSHLQSLATDANETNLYLSGPSSLIFSGVPELLLKWGKETVCRYGLWLVYAGPELVFWQRKHLSSYVVKNHGACDSSAWRPKSLT